MAYGPIRLAYTINGCGSLVSLPEKASETYKIGHPLRLVSGEVAQCDIATSSGADWAAADLVLGISVGAGQNLTTAGTALPAASEATPPGQASAITFPAGAWTRDGYAKFYRADGQNVFVAALKSGQTFANSLVGGGPYTLKYDSTSTYWYVDNTDTSGNNACVEIVGGLSSDTSKVLFRFKSTQRVYD